MDTTWLSLQELAHAFKVSDKVVRNEFKRLRGTPENPNSQFLKEVHWQQVSLGGKNFIYKIDARIFAAITELRLPNDVRSLPFLTEVTSSVTSDDSQQDMSDSPKATLSGEMDTVPDIPQGAHREKQGNPAHIDPSETDIPQGSLLDRLLTSTSNEVETLKEHIEFLKGELKNKNEEISEYRVGMNDARDLIKIMSERVVEISKAALPEGTLSVKHQDTLDQLPGIREDSQDNQQGNLQSIPQGTEGGRKDNPEGTDQAEQVIPMGSPAENSANEQSHENQKSA